MSFRQRGYAAMVQLPTARVVHGPGQYDSLVLELDDAAMEKLRKFDDHVLKTIIQRRAWGLLGKYATEEEIREAYRPVVREEDRTVALKAKDIQVFGPTGKLSKNDLQSDDEAVVIASPGWLFFKDDKITVSMLANQAYIASKASDIQAECLVCMDRAS